ncbi:hypothetical protein SNR26_02010 [Pectobacterium brasiliense]|uniref:hypothetical protein n=1 Tax=Pectobacterium brasiliense TaxID=180957 RepID=UPI002A7F98E4|nr:hypothetical protein [Pectobacterium brasiliense]MDY4366499.1 hypothetical protein [Pectobacterium brasiliense]MDY7056030.1 hypothetical protein [Pectobacterium brasiliense]
MLKRIPGSARYRTDEVIRDILRTHDGFREARWNHLEKVILFCSTHYIKSIGLLFSGFAALFTLLYFLKPCIKPLAEQYAPAWKTLFDWQTSLLGGQLTIIGIVYPLVVGLVSVIFQKKSTRKIVQTAYQRYSGFMFAGLSGLSLSAFILAGSLIRPFSSNYSYAILCGIAILWMLLNIGLSIWFFIQSISVLHDAHRERMVFRYLVSDAFIPAIRDIILQGFLRQPIRYRMLNAGAFQAIRLHDNDSEHDYQTITKKYEASSDLLDIWYRPLTLILKHLDTRLAGKKQQVSLAFFPRYVAVSGNARQPIFKIKGGDIGEGYLMLLRACFRFGERKSLPVNQEALVKGISGDIYDALSEGDINAFEEAVHNTCRTFSGLLNVFQYSLPQGTHNLLLIKDGVYDDSFVEKFYTELYLLFRQAMLKTEVSDRFFARCMRIPQMIYGMRDRVTLRENQLGLMYTGYAWETLMDWGHTNHLRMTLSQRQVYEGLVTKFVELWEGWLDVITNRNTRFPDDRTFHDALRKHLLTLPQIVVSAIRSGDTYAADWALDLLHRWAHKLRLDDDVDVVKYFFSTPASITSKALTGQAYRNGLVDIRLCTAAFLIHQAAEEPTLHVESAVHSLLAGSLTEKTGVFDNGSLAITSGQQIIDIYLRTYLWGGRNFGSEPGWLGGLIGELSAANGKPMISGRVYMGNRLTDVGDLITAFVQLGIMMSSSVFQVSQAVKQSLEGNVFDYRGKEKVAYILNAIREHTDQQTQFTLPHKDDFGACKDRFQQTLAAYCDAVVQSQRQDIEKVEIDEERLIILGHKVSTLLREKLETHPLMTFFSSTQFSKKTDGFVENTAISISDKEYYARGIKTSPILNEVSEWVGTALKDMWNDILSKQLRRDAECNMQVAHFADILTFVCESETVDNGSKLVVSGRAFFDEYQAWCCENSAAADAMLSFDKSDNKYLKTSKGLCRLIFAPWLDLHCAILTDDTYFDHLSIAESTKGDIITLSGRPVPDNPYHIKLHMTYSIQERYHGNIRMRFQRNEN